jgi:hypothetical protein
MQAFGEVPGPLKRDVETRAVERFFVNWTLHPSNHGVTPGIITLAISQPEDLRLGS